MKNIMIVGPIPPPVGGIPLYVKKLIDSKHIKKHFNLILFNTAIAKSIRRFEKRNERSYFSFLSDGVISGLKLFLFVFATFLSFTGYMINKKPAVVQVFTSSFWGFWRSCIYIMIAKIFRVKTIFHLLNAIDVFWRESTGFSRSLIMFVLNKCDVLLVQSDGIKNFVEGISDTPVVAIYNGVEIWRYNRISSKGYFSAKTIQVVFVGGLSKNKGVFDILKAVQLINNIDIHFTFVGGGPVDEFLDYAHKLGVNEQVSFLGRISEEKKVELLMDSHIFVLPSYAEGQPVAILEAMAAGQPIISTSVGSIPEIVSDGKNGFLIEPGDINKLAEKISTLAEDSTLRNKMSEHNYKQTRKLYDVRRVFSELEGVYNTV
jgi:glycosyltransferase involved in cell wall biosynthesis